MNLNIFDRVCKYNKRFTTTEFAEFLEIAQIIATFLI